MSIDVLSWDLFNDNAIKRSDIIPDKVNLENRLIFETKNFFAVCGLGAFIKGYTVIITKDYLNSFAILDEDILAEFNWITDKINNFYKAKYNKEIATFEHGMCSCAGGLDHAHVHMMPVPKDVDNSEIIQIIEKVLKKRSAGIEKIKFNNHTFDNVHDISTIINFNDNYEILEGKLLKFEDLKNYDEDFEKIRPLLLAEEQYINFKVPAKNFLFCTTHYLGTQFGREVVSEISLNFDKKLKEYFSSLNRSNPTKLIWRWQDYNFEKNILQTMRDLSNYLKSIKSEKNYIKFKMVNFIN